MMPGPELHHEDFSLLLHCHRDIMVCIIFRILIPWPGFSNSALMFLKTGRVPCGTLLCYGPWVLDYYSLYFQASLAKLSRLFMEKIMVDNAYNSPYSHTCSWGSSSYSALFFSSSPILSLLQGKVQFSFNHTLNQINWHYEVQPFSHCSLCNLQHNLCF